MSGIVLANDMGEVGMAAAVEVLERGGSALDAVEAGILRVEADEKVRWVGRGGDPNLLGEIECDAAIMNGADRAAGAVGALVGYLHAIRVARRVMERLPHVMLVGRGAARFAAECGEAPADLFTDEAEERYRAWIAKHVPAERREKLPDGPLADLTWPSAIPDHAKGTTVFLVRDGAGRIAGGTSSSGWAYKYPGRLGDSPIIGAGLYVHDQFGACGCTHTGEMTIRAGTATSVIRYMQKGASVEDACREAVVDLSSLAGGYLGPVVIHALDGDGSPFVVSTTSKAETPWYWVWSEDEGKVQRCTASSIDQPGV
jgi:L-asparaginase / beta-aspartyl-peptidase